MPMSGEGTRTSIGDGHSAVLVRVRQRCVSKAGANAIKTEVHERRVDAAETYAEAKRSEESRAPSHISRSAA